MQDDFAPLASGSMLRFCALVERISRRAIVGWNVLKYKTTPSRYFFILQSLLIASAMMCREQVGALETMDRACRQFVDVEIDLAFFCSNAESVVAQSTYTSNMPTRRATKV
jgi:hypothetical protein